MYWSTDYSILICPTCGREHDRPTVWPLVCRCRTKIGPDGAEHVPQPMDRKPIRPCEIDTRRPGDHLRALLKERRYTSRSGCGCDDRVAEMNRRGVEWCEANRDAIAGWLLKNARYAGIFTRIAAMMTPRQVHAFCGRLVDEALTRAKAIDETRVAIITTHYNPTGSERLKATFDAWAPTLPIKPICYEMVLPGSESEIPGSRAMLGDSRCVMWQKERMINHAISQLPASVCYVAWVDHDLVFSRTDWLHAGIDAIDSGADAVQLFGKVIHLDRDGNPTRETPSALAQVEKTGSISGGAPGGAWIARRSWLDSIGGLFDRNVVGGGDSTFFEAVTRSRTDHISQQVAGLAAECHEYIARVGGCRWGYIRGDCRHLWHGDRANRQYVSRHDILRRHGFNPSRHLERSPSGLYRWTEATQAELIDDVRGYFASRREDG